MDKCIYCGKPAYAIDLEYDEGYCKSHFDQQQRSSEPVENYRVLDA
jgi:hypothetical protein